MQAPIPGIRAGLRGFGHQFQPRDRAAPEVCSDGSRPRYAPILEPVNRFLSPTSTANPKAVRVETPRRQPRHWTTAVNSLSKAMVFLAVS